MANQHTSGTASLTTVQRFWSKIEFTDTCWLWTAGLFANGYGAFRSGTKHVKAHRYAYEFCVGPIPEGLTIDHLCRTRSCVLSDHLEPVTHQVNILRGEGIAARHARQTHCKRGHEFTPENTYINAKRRFCRRCLRRYSGRAAMERKDA